MSYGYHWNKGCFLFSGFILCVHFPVHFTDSNACERSHTWRRNWRHRFLHQPRLQSVEWFEGGSWIVFPFFRGLRLWYLLPWDTSAHPLPPDSVGHTIVKCCPKRKCYPSPTKVSPTPRCYLWAMSWRLWPNPCLNRFHRWKGKVELKFFSTCILLVGSLPINLKKNKNRFKFPNILQRSGWKMHLF